MTSSLKQLLVHMAPGKAAMNRLALARTLAHRHTSSLAALYAVTSAFMELAYAPEISPALVNDIQAMDDQRKRSVLQAFDESATAALPRATWAETLEVPVVGSFCQQAHYADLLVLGQHDPQDPDTRCVPADFVPSVIAASGRPALVIPYVGWTGEVGKTVVIAWKDTAQAARAVAGALPLLREAARVHIVTWSGGDAPAVTGHQLYLKRYLELHGVPATVHLQGDEPSEIGELLLSLCADFGADLLVMGCYGHSRIREWVLGGASRTVLTGMTLPVLMAH